jgi:hypothetical protein
MTWAAKIMTSILFVFFLGAMFFSLFHMSMGMDMSQGMSDCPFMSHEEVICPMNLIDHIDAWKSTFLSVVSAFTVLFVAIGAAVLIPSIAPNLLLKIQFALPAVRKWLHAKIYTFSYRLLQELFSKGILHPKLY